MALSTSNPTPAEVMYLMAKATDELDTTLMESLFVPGQTVRIDARKHLGFPPMDILPDQAAKNMIDAISGITATHHVISNPFISYDLAAKTKVKASAYKTAYHCIQQDDGEIHSATARGTWDMDLEEVNGWWMVRSFTVVRTVPLLKTELELWNIAKARVADGNGRSAMF